METLSKAIEHFSNPLEIATIQPLKSSSTINDKAV